MKYESSILKRLIDTYGVIGNPRYLSEIIKEFIVRGKELYPNLFTYQSDWLAHIDEFGLTPDYVVSYTGQQIYAPHTKERPVKRAILKGNTLVNSATKLIGHDSWNTTDNVVFTHNGGSYLGFINYDCILKPNTKYLIKFNYDYISDKNLKLQVGFRTNLGGWDVHHIASTKGVNQFTLTTKDTSNNLSIIIMSGQTLTSATLGELMIIEYQGGMENWDIPYFSGMQSVKMPVLTTKGKNMVGKLVYGSVSTGGNIVDNMNQKRVRTDYVNIENGEKITIKTHSEEVNYSISFFYDENKKFISQTSWSSSVTDSNGLTILIPSNAKYVICEFTHNLPSDKDLALSDIKVQIEKGDTATSYEPFKTNILTVNEPIDLGKVGDAQDTLNVLTGEVVENTELLTLSGVEDWRLITYTGTETNRFRLALSHKKVTNTQLNLICDKIQAVPNNQWNQDKELIESDGEFISVRKNFPTLQEFKSWLATNPLTIRYIKEKVIKTVDLSIKDQNDLEVSQLSSFNGGTHFTTTSQEGSLQPTIIVDVVTDLEETLNLCSMDGNTL